MGEWFFLLIVAIILVGLFWFLYRDMQDDMSYIQKKREDHEAVLKRLHDLFCDRL